MALDNILAYRETFDTNIRQLAGLPTRQDLKMMATVIPGEGAGMWIDSFRGSDSATDEVLQDRYTRNQITATSTVSELLSSQNIHEPITRQRTLIAPRLIHRTYFVPQHEQKLTVIDPASYVMKGLMQDIFVKENEAFVRALNAPTVARVPLSSTDFTSTINESLAASQQVDSQKVGYLSVDDFLVAQELFSLQSVDDMNEEWYCLLHPTDYRKFVVNEIDVIQNKDYVAGSRESFEKGLVPMCEGFGLVKSRYQTEGTVTFFTKGAVAWVAYDSNYNTSVDVLPKDKFALQLYVDINYDCKRIDDAKVVKTTIQAGS